MYLVTKDLQDFALAHRLGKGYPYKCKNLHGHNYKVQVTLGAKELDRYDMTIDFGDIKKHFSTWIQDNWDHATMVAEKDKTLLEFLELGNNRKFIIPDDQNSTAEFMSKFLFDKFNWTLREKGFSKRVTLFLVKVWETADSCASYGSVPMLIEEATPPEGEATPTK